MLTNIAVSDIQDEAVAIVLHPVQQIAANLQYRWNEAVEPLHCPIMKKATFSLTLAALLVGPAHADLFCDIDDTSYQVELIDSGFTISQGDVFWSCEAVGKEFECTSRAGETIGLADPIRKNPEDGTMWFDTDPESLSPRLMVTCP